MSHAATRSRPLLGLLAALIALLATVLPTAIWAPASADPQSPVPRLQREGRYLVDNEGRLVIVHGVNLVWKHAPYVPPNTPEGFMEADAQWLYDHGFNGARLGVLWPGVTPDSPTTQDSDYFAKWQRIVDLLADRHIWMQFDMHQDQWHETYGGEGVPDWAMIRPFPYSLFPNQPLPFPFGYVSPEVSTVYDQFWADERHLLDHWVTYWEFMTQQYKDQPYSMGYDLINEPWVGQEWLWCLFSCEDSHRQELQPAYNKALAAIRAIDPTSLVWYAPQTLSSGLPLETHLASVPGEENLGLSWHSYCPATFAESAGLPFDLTEACVLFASDRSAHALRQAQRMDAVPMMNEWGSTDNLRALEIDADAADANTMSWQHWAYKEWNDPTTQDSAQGLFTNDADLSSTKDGKLLRLVRTYPQATSGRDLKFDYDHDSGKFTMGYTGDADIDAPTRIFVSPLTSPDGFDVATSHGTVTINGSYVEIDAPTNERVQITITPRD